MKICQTSLTIGVECILPEGHEGMHETENGDVFIHRFERKTGSKPRLQAHVRAELHAMLDRLMDATPIGGDGAFAATSERHAQVNMQIAFSVGNTILETIMSTVDVQRIGLNLPSGPEMVAWMRRLEKKHCTLEPGHRGACRYD